MARWLETTRNISFIRTQTQKYYSTTFLWATFHFTQMCFIHASSFLSLCLYTSAFLFYSFYGSLFLRLFSSFFYWLFLSLPFLFSLAEWIKLMPCPTHLLSSLFFLSVPFHSLILYDIIFCLYYALPFVFGLFHPFVGSFFRSRANTFVRKTLFLCSFFCI